MTDNYTTGAQNKKILEVIFASAMDLYKAMAPAGLITSEYIHFFHPTPEQQYNEYKKMSENINRVLKKEPENHLQREDFIQGDISGINEVDEFTQILSLSVYDIFSNNHMVKDESGKIYDFGSMRGTGRFIADFLNDRYFPEQDKYDYLDFYMGTVWISSRASLLPLYEYIFTKLQQLKCNWVYTFPRLYLVDLCNDENSEANQDAENYDPAQSVLQQIETLNKDKEKDKLQEKFDDTYRQEYEEAKYKTLQPLVQAYKTIYGRLPDGHPQKEIK